jgi:hypothetical protein
VLLPGERAAGSVLPGVRRMVEGPSRFERMVDVIELARMHSVGCDNAGPIKEAIERLETT